MLLDLVSLKKQYDLNIKGVLHIGAHFGQEMNVYDNLEIKNVIFFEPLPHVFEVLKNNVGSRAVLYNTALGNMEGIVEMNVESANQGMSSSILEPILHTMQYPNIIFNEKVEVTINKLDNVMVNHNKEDFNFICIDVQGYELEVFKGSINTLKTVDFIISEVNRDEVYKNCTKVEELDKFLSQFGFERVETNWVGHTWGDAFYVKRNEK
jgi:FkbM family methyltransferase